MQFLANNIPSIFRAIYVFLACLYCARKTNLYFQIIDVFHRVPFFSSFHVWKYFLCKRFQPTRSYASRAIPFNGISYPT